MAMESSISPYFQMERLQANGMSLLWSRVLDCQRKIKKVYNRCQRSQVVRHRPAKPWGGCSNQPASSKYAVLAQLEEQYTFNVLVGGSSPLHRTSRRASLYTRRTPISLWQTEMCIRTVDDQRVCDYRIGASAPEAGQRPDDVSVSEILTENDNARGKLLAA